MSRPVCNDMRLGFTASWLKPRSSTTRLIASVTVASAVTGAHSLSSDFRARSFSTASADFQRSHVILGASRGYASRAETPAEDPPRGSIAIVFTDIVKSTHIWERSPAAMKEAMDLHDDLVRSLATQHHGYEVKQNGDGFMIAFQTAVAALEFCLDVQKRLMEVEWPEALLEMRAGSEVRAEDPADGGEEEVLWKGLRLRMSAHFGEPVCKWNEVIRRMDYLGPMVNRAARFIQVTEGGQIVVSEEFLEELQKAKGGQAETEGGPLFDKTRAKGGEGEMAKLDLRDLRRQEGLEVLTEEQFEVRVLGERHFKGVEGMQKLYFIIPYSLRGRVGFWPKHLHVPGSKGNLT